MAREAVNREPPWGPVGGQFVLRINTGLRTGLLNVFRMDDSPRVCQECLRETCMIYTP